MMYRNVGLLRQTIKVQCILPLICICLCVLMYFDCSSSVAQTGISDAGRERPEVGDSVPIHIESDRMDAMDQSGTVVFTGHVKATRNDLTIYSDKLDVFYEKKTGGKGERKKTKKVIRQIVATGHVRINQGERLGTGEKAVYDKAAEKITITGAAQVWEGPNRVGGDTITFFINEDRSVVEGSSEKKVQALVYPAD